MSWIVATHAMVANMPEKRKEKKGKGKLRKYEIELNRLDISGRFFW